MRVRPKEGRCSALIMWVVTAFLSANVSYIINESSDAVRFILLQKIVVEFELSAWTVPGSKREEGTSVCALSPSSLIQVSMSQWKHFQRFFTGEMQGTIDLTFLSLV